MALADELSVALGALRIHSEDQRILLLRAGPTVAKLAELLAADAGIIAGVENQHHVVAAQRGERNDFAVLIGEREIGRGRARKKRVCK